MAKYSEGELIWHGDYPPEVVERVRAEIASDLDGKLDEASDLCFHTVFLGDDYNTCPVVLIWGAEGDTALHCEYHATGGLVTINSDDDEE